MDIKKIIFESPLYSKWNNKVFIENEGNQEETRLNTLISEFNERVELYCTECKAKRIFAADRVYEDVGSISSPHFPYHVKNKPSLYKTFRCSANHDHKLFYGFLVHVANLVKIAEYPSKYDSIKDNFNQYEDIIGNEKVTELAKASQLESFGYSIAAFLFYRRVYEHLIFRTFIDSDIKNKESEDEFRKKRMEDKIEYLSEYLPVYFKDNAHLYSVLSKGIHELEENECSNYIPLAKSILYYSLDEAVDNRKKANRKNELAKKLNEINSKLK